ncbi:hypothetical protein H5410_007070 [Solanum commersonii]|uniref:PGG domain-containing protein n=1 Tax=Solanum commersonii TaxID=4109 RepID=A0A9J6AC09_SOLCO|nr:hypothetical protein H5410_007070 [Solanum commersonii]
MDSKSSHDIEPVAQDCEQFGSRERRDIENPLPDPVLAFMQFEDIIMANKSSHDVKSVAHTCEDNGSHIEDQSRTLARSIGFVQELMKLMKADDLEVKNKLGETAFYYVAMSGCIEIDHVALNIFNKDKELASKMLQLGNSEILSISSSLECRGNLKKCSGAYSSPVWRKFISVISMAKRHESYRIHPHLIWRERRLCRHHYSGFLEQCERYCGSRKWRKLHHLYSNWLETPMGRKTPKKLFREENKVLLKEGERWMKDTANSCMLVATLIATMVLAVGFTAPGGYNDDNGIPILLELNGFIVFIISDAVAVFTSIVSIIMFLSILTSRYAEDDFLVSLPAKLLFGLTMLFVSIFSMLLAFAATFFLVYSNHMGWEPKLIAACAGVPLALFGCLQYKLWFDLVKSTYRSKFLFKPGKHSLF